MQRIQSVYAIILANNDDDSFADRDIFRMGHGKSAAGGCADRKWSKPVNQLLPNSLNIHAYSFAFSNRHVKAGHGFLVCQSERPAAASGSGQCPKNNNPRGEIRNSLRAGKLAPLGMD
jgi:hypothetical protein